MIAITGTARVFLFGKPVDMRKGFEGLSSLVEEQFEDDLVSGSYFAFVNRRRDRIKVLYWDADGLAIWYKRLEKGTFASRDLDKNPLGRREFMLLLEGVTPQKIHRRYRVS